MRRLLERGVYFTSTVTTSTKQIRCTVCARNKMENRVCDKETNLICTNAKPRDVVYISTLMSLSSSGSTMLASLAYGAFLGEGEASIRRGRLIQTLHLRAGVY